MSAPTTKEGQPMNEIITHEPGSITSSHPGEPPVMAVPPVLTPQDRLKQNSELIMLLAPQIKSKHLANIQGKLFMCVGGGIAVANALGYTVSVSEATIDKDMKATKATATLHNSEGVAVASAVGYVGDDEARWSNGPVFARYSMTQTRAEAKLCRANFGHLYCVLGASTDTPAEEMQGVAPVAAPVVKPVQEGVSTRAVVMHPNEPGVVRPSDQASGPPPTRKANSEAFHVTSVENKLKRNGEPLQSKSGNPCMAIALSNGIIVDTFKGSWIDMARDAMQTGRQVHAEWATNSYGDHKLEAMSMAASTGVAEEELPF